MLIGKSCENCGGKVSLSTKVGDYCPHCRVRFGGERTTVVYRKRTRTADDNGGCEILGYFIILLIVGAWMGIAGLISYFGDRSAMKQVTGVMSGEVAAAGKEGRTLAARLAAQITLIDEGPFSMNRYQNCSLKVKSPGSSEPARFSVELFHPQLPVSKDDKPPLLLVSLASQRGVSVMPDGTATLLSARDFRALRDRQSSTGSPRSRPPVLDSVFSPIESIAQKLRDYARGHGGAYPERPEEAFAGQSVFAGPVRVSERVTRHECTVPSGTFAFWYVGGSAEDRHRTGVFLLELSAERLSGLVGTADGSVEWVMDESFKAARKEFGADASVETLQRWKAVGERQDALVEQSRMGASCLREAAAKNGGRFPPVPDAAWPRSRPSGAVCSSSWQVFETTEPLAGYEVWYWPSAMLADGPEEVLFTMQPGNGMPGAIVQVDGTLKPASERLLEQARELRNLKQEETRRKAEEKQRQMAAASEAARLAEEMQKFEGLKRTDAALRRTLDFYQMAANARTLQGTLTTPEARGAVERYIQELAPLHKARPVLFTAVVQGVVSAPLRRPTGDALPGRVTAADLDGVTVSLAGRGSTRIPWSGLMAADVKRAAANGCAVARLGPAEVKAVQDLLGILVP